MTRRHWLDLGPSLLIGAGILASTFLASLAVRSGWPVLTAPLLLALTVVSADVLHSRLRGKLYPSPAALILGGAFLLASWIVATRDPNLVKSLIPVIGVAAWVILLPRRKPCRAPGINP